jgi:hypothetical protein
MTRRLMPGVAGLVAGAVLALAMPVRAQAVSLGGLLAKAADYAATFVERFGNVITEEQFDQGLERMANGGWVRYQRRVLRSDLLFVGGGPLGGTMLRDVFEVDGQPVRDRQDRLTKIFAQPAATVLAQATRIADESARYNIGPGQRTTNTPELAVLFVQRAVQPRFAFTLGDRDGSIGPNVWTVDYKEQGRPTVVRRMDPKQDPSLPASGRLWIDADTGQVLRTAITFDLGLDVQRLTTMFAFDPRLQIAVPMQMTEIFDVGVIRVNATATYSRFRSFGVSTDETVKN